MSKILHPITAILVLAVLTAACSAPPSEPQPSAGAPFLEIAGTGTISSTPSPTGTEPRVEISPTATLTPSITPSATPTPTPTHPLMIEVMRQAEYPGSEIIFEETLEPGANYDRYIISYRSEGNKIYALFTVPWGEVPQTGWPVILFNHGYIPPEQYRTTERYVDYVDVLARNGYIIFRSDYRGHGSSEGDARSSYQSPGYTIDVLNAIATVKRYPHADPDRIGMWGHSMGGNITLRAMVVSDEIKAGVIWGGVVVSYPDLVDLWWRAGDSSTAPTQQANRRRFSWRTELTEIYGSFEENPEFWASISANSYAADLSGPIQLHHGTADESVPYELSEVLYSEITAVNLPVEIYLYEGDNHNISNFFWSAMQRTVEFFDAHVKGINGE